ncbi:MAG TPA: ATP-binding protein [Anaerolineae bacterium]
MKLFTPLRQRLVLKLFLSYLVIIIVGVSILGVTAVLNAPTALDRHMADMQSMMGGAVIMSDLQSNFTAAFNEVLLYAAGASVIAAVVVSMFTARRIVRPLRDMTEVSRRIAAGSYHQRVQISDEDELGTLAHSFNQMAEVLEQTERRRVELIGNVAHELRTPLSSIRGTMEGLVDGVLPADASTFQGVQHAVTRLQRLVHDLEELSRAEAGQIPLDLRQVDVRLLIRSAADRLQMQYDDKGVRLQIEGVGVMPAVQIDSARITQVLINLLGNALQYTPSGGSVTVQAWADSREALVSIHDTGAGISAEHLPHLFERFYRVDRSRSRAGGGSGIGLTISKYLVEAHGGHIWAESAGVGLGSTFTFTLPLA